MQTPGLQRQEGTIQLSSKVTPPDPPLVSLSLILFLPFLHHRVLVPRGSIHRLTTPSSPPLMLPPQTPHPHPNPNLGCWCP